MMAFVARPTLAATPFFLLPPHISRCGICLAATVATEVSLPPPPRMPPLAQMATLLSVYWLHVARLSEWTLRLPFALSVDVENIIGVAIVATSILRSVRRCSPPVPPPWGRIRTKRTLLISTVFSLLAAYLFSGYVSTTVDSLLSISEGRGLRLTVGQHRATHVLLSHLAWVGMAARVLGTRLKPFFPPPFGKGTWLNVRWRANWLPWAVGGYFASLLSYNAIEGINEHLLPPPPALDPGIAASAVDAAESVVNRLVHPEDGDLIALSIGSIAPCVSAPVFEEVLYRGFLLPSLCRFMPLRMALPLHALLFGLHHNALPSLLPLSVLGLLWGVLYIRSGNLLVPILVHALWNSRIFLSSLRDLQMV